MSLSRQLARGLYVKSSTMYARRCCKCVKSLRQKAGTPQTSTPRLWSVLIYRSSTRDPNKPTCRIILQLNTHKPVHLTGTYLCRTTIVCEGNSLAGGDSSSGNDTGNRNLLGWPMVVPRMANGCSLGVSHHTGRATKPSVNCACQHYTDGATQSLFLFFFWPSSPFHKINK